MTCPNERRLLELHMGDGSDADRRHVADCTACGARLAALVRDLERIDTVVREAPRPLPASPARAWRLAPVALVAMLALAVVLHRHRQASVMATDDDTLALADEVADALVADVAFDDEAGDPAAPSTCTWGDPLLGVGCDEPAVMQIAWR